MNNTQPHNQDGHLNTHILDHDDDCTGRGTHDRVVACVPEGNRMYCRVDLKWELGVPNVAQILKAAKVRNGGEQRGKWTLDKSEPWDCGKSIDYYFVKL